MSEKITVVFEAKTGQATKDANKLKDGIKDAGNAAEKTSGDIGGVTSAADKATGGLLTMGKSGLRAVLNVAKGFTTLRGAILSTGLGALVIIIASVVAAFKSSEEGQNKFAKIMSVIGAVTGNFVDLLADFGEKVIGAFENPGKALKDFGKLLVENITNRFEAILKFVPSVAKSIGLLFKGQFKEAGKVAFDSVAQIVTGIENASDKIEEATEKTKDFIKQNVEEGKKAAEVANMRAKADKLERELIVERSQLESQIAQLRLKSRQEDQFTAEERKAALLEAQELEDGLLSKEMEALQLRADAQTAENTFARSNKENLDLEAELIARVNRQQANRINQQRSTQRELNRVNKEIEADEKAKTAEETRLLKEQQKAKAEADKLEADERRKVLEATLSAQDLETLKVQEKYDELVRLAEKYGEDTTVLEQNRQEELDKINAKEIDNEKKLQDGKLALANKGAQAIGSLATALAGDNEKAQKTAFKVNKALNIGTAVMNTANAISGALATVNPIPGARFIEAGIAGASGLAQILAIKSTKFGDTSASGGDSGSSGGGAFGRSLGPSVGVVGGGTNANTQLLGAISSNTEKPGRAYVVGQDVTTQQSLDRRIVENATFG